MGAPKDNFKECHNKMIFHNRKKKIGPGASFVQSLQYLLESICIFCASADNLNIFSTAKPSFSQKLKLCEVQGPDIFIF